jgi:hypothetical protein
MMRSATLYITAALCLVLIVSLAWWTRDFVPAPPDPEGLVTRYTLQEGDTPESVAEAFRLPFEDLAAANGASGIAQMPSSPGSVLTIPSERSLASTWGVHGAGLVAEMLGVLLSFWLAAMIGLLPKPVRGQIFGISLVLALVSYAAAQSVAATNPSLTPQFLFGALKDGFMWSAAFPMLARLLGIKNVEAIQPQE